jgi:hypothetical protein
MFGFGKKVDAGEGLLSVGISAALVSLEELGPTAEGISLAAFGVGYVSAKHDIFGAKGPQDERFGEYVWTAVCHTFPEVHSRFMLFAVGHVQAQAFLAESSADEAINDYWLFVDGDSNFEIHKGDFVERTQMLLKIADMEIERKSKRWRKLK